MHLLLRDSVPMLQRLQGCIRRAYESARSTLTDARDLLRGLDCVAAFAFAIVSVMKPRADLVLENLALRHQIAVLKRKQTRPRIERFDRLFWLLLRRLWSGWAHVLALVEPATVVRWHRLGFRLFWRGKLQKRAGGRSAISREIRELIRGMASENATWGAPRIHAEFLKLGLKVSERTVSRFMPKRPAPPDALKRWIAFLRNHAGEIAAMDFFVVPTATFRVLYVWFAIRHGRRELAHFAVTEHPHAAWVAQQIRDAFPFDSAPRHLIFDGDKCFGSEVKRTIRNLGTKQKRIAPLCPWQNGVAERWVSSCRRELIDHVVPLGAAHLRRLLRSYVEYYNGDRCHLSLDKDAPNKRTGDASTIADGGAPIVAESRRASPQIRMARRSLMLVAVSQGRRGRTSCVELRAAALPQGSFVAEVHDDRPAVDSDGRFVQLPVSVVRTFSASRSSGDPLLANDRHRTEAMHRHYGGLTRRRSSRPLKLPSDTFV